VILVLQTDRQVSLLWEWVLRIGPGVSLREARGARQEARGVARALDAARGALYLPFVQRLGVNRGGYQGERIDIARVLRDDVRAARAHGWEVARLRATPEVQLLALHRPPRQGTTRAAVPRVYLSTGIHGDEPAGPLALRQLLQEDRWPRHVELWCCPCLNPTGFPLNRRENAAGRDLNRDYRHVLTPEIRAHVGWLRRQPAFDLTLCLHEDWEAHGFYVYELNPDQQASLAEELIRAVGAVCPIDRSPVIEGRPASGGIIRPDLDPTRRPQWPEAFFLIRNKTRLSYTLEAPSDWPLPVRVAGLVTAARRAVELIAARR
jgi:hypothetical protein